MKSDMVLLTSFVGRHDEIDQLRRRLATNRIVTLTGPGGIGKTRLALQVAREHPNAARTVDLSAVNDPEALAAAVASAAPLDILNASASLLVLDNCEHVAAACATVVHEILAACPLVTVLATSRLPLGIDGEATVRLGPLSREEALRLFSDRVRLHSEDFAVDDGNAAEAVRICDQLDGVPLAIELAAARAASLSLRAIAERLDDRLALLTREGGAVSPRHRSLRAALDWSYDLLDPQMQRLLCRLAVFAGGFTLEAAEEVCAGRGIGGDRVASIVSALVEQSLVQPEPSATETRYRLLETVRRYAFERLGTGRDTTMVLRREGEFWAIGAEHAPSRIRDGRGVRTLAVLLSQPGREIHVLDPSITPGADTGDAGPLLDAPARAAYRRRLAELDEEIDESRSWNDPQRVERAEHERDALLRQLSAAVGIGGRVRRAGDASERARVAATRAIKLALTKIEERDPSLAGNLRAAVRTGTFLSYTPDASRPVRFVVTA